MTTSPHFAGALPRLARLAAPAACAIAAGLVACPARATEVADWHDVDTPMPDSTLQFGTRKLHLPPGHWTLVKRFDMRISTSHGEGVAVSTAWAVRIEDDKFRMAVVLSLPNQRMMGLNRWGPDPCQRTRWQIYQHAVSSSAATPECISIEGFHAFMRSMRATNPQVAQWFETHTFDDADGLVHILYTKYYNATFGRLSVLLPIQSFESDAQAIGWADSLPGLLGPLLDGDGDDATLPEPAPAAPPGKP